MKSPLRKPCLLVTLRSVILPLGHCLTLFAGLCFSASYASADLPSTSQPFKSGTGYGAYRIPALVVTNAGTVIACADGRANLGDIPTAIDCVIRRSTDNGNTWGDRIVVANYGTNSSDTDLYPLYNTTTAQSRSSASDPSLLVDRSNGRIWVFYDNGSPASYSGFGRTIKLEMRFSDDDGQTWSARKDIEAQNPALRPKATETFSFNGTTSTYGTAEYIVGPGNGIQTERGTHAGRLIFPVYWYRTSNNSSFIYSDDHGTTWQRGGICGTGTGELQITELTNGDLLASMRPSGAASGYRWFSKSTDGGVTWSAMFRFTNTATYPVPDPACQGNIFRLSTTADSDKNRLVHANAASTGSRDHMTVRTSYDEGASWSQSRLVYTGGGAYSSLARLANGDIGLLYEKDNYASIDFVRITIPEATNNTDAQPGYNLWANTRFTLAQLMNPAISGKDADPDGNSITNYQEYLNAAAARPSASIAANDAVAYEAGTDTTAQFTVTLSAAAATDIAVNLSFGGTATAGTDYSTPPAFVTVPAGQTQATVTITGLDDAVIDGQERVIAMIATGSGDFPPYTLGTSLSATATVDDLYLQGVIIVATDTTAAETGGNTGTFTITRNDTTSAATVAYTVGGTATAGSDYTTLGGSVSFTAGQATATMNVLPLDDILYERTPETVIVTLAQGPNYTLGYPTGATVTISSDETNPHKANNNDALNQSSSWLGDAPIVTETPLWDSIITGAVTNTLGTDTTWAGIRVEGGALAPGGTATIQGSNALSAGNVFVGAGGRLALGNGGSALSLGTLSGSGTLALNKTGNQDMSSSLNAANAINFTGTLQLRGDGNWTVLGNSSTTQTTGTKFHLDTGVSSSNQREFIMGNAWDGRTLTLASLSGYGNIRADWSNTNVIRSLLIEQDIDTIFYGKISGHAANGRTVALSKSGTGTLTLSGVLGDLVTVNQSGGILVLSAVNTYTGATTVNGGTLLLTGTLPATATTVSGGILAGTGTVKGATTISGTLSPGISGIGTITVNNVLTLNATGTVAMQINKSGATRTADKVQGVTTLTYGGTLVVTATGDALAAGDSFTLFSATSYTSSFATLTLPALPGSLAWDSSTLVTNGSISVKAAQSITFGALPVKMTGSADFVPGATASSGLGVTYISSNTAVATIVSGQIHIVGVGTTIITASQAGDTTYAPAVAILQELTVNAFATTAIWTNTAGGAWGTAPNWQGGTVASGSTAIADFSTLNITSDTTVTLSTTATTVAGLKFGDIMASNNWTLSGTKTLTLALTGGTPAITVSNQTATLATVIAGNQGFVKDGPGALVISATNTFSGDTTINGGILELSSTGSLYGSAYNNTDIVTVNPGATLRMASFAYNTAGSLGQLAEVAQRRVLNGGTIEVTGTTHSSSNDFTVTATGGTFRYTPSGQMFTLAGSANSDIQLGGLLTFDGAGNITVSEVLAGTGDLIKTGAGTLFLNSAINTFTGNVSVFDGMLQTGTAQGGGTAGYLGAVNGTRTIVVGAGATLLMQGNNNFGGTGKTAATIPALTVSGILRATRFNILGNLTLSGGTLTQSSTDSGNYEGWQFLGTVTVAGSSPSTISSGNGKANHLIGAGVTVFNVADTADLIVSNPLRNGSNDYPGAGALRKESGGTMVLSGTNTFTGATTVAGGTLAVTGTLGATAVTVQTGATLGGNGNIGGPVTIESGGHHALAIAATPATQITRTITGPLTLTSGNILDLTAATQPAAGVYVLATATGGITGTPATVNRSGFSGTLAIAGNNLQLTVAPDNSYATWAATNAAGTTPDQDSDHDGVPNGIEYFMGLSGSSFAANPPMVEGKITWPKDPAANATYVVETSTRLKDEVTPGDGGWAPTTLGVVDNGNSVQYTAPVGNPRIFVRIKVVIP